MSTSNVYKYLNLEKEKISMENENPLGDLEITEEGLLKEELQDAIKARMLATIEDLLLIDVELETFVQLVKQSVEDNKDSPENLQTLFDYLDEMWGGVIVLELQDVLLDALCVVQERKHEIEEVLIELEETLEK
jgi:hypothetical protein